MVCKRKSYKIQTRIHLALSRHTPVLFLSPAAFCDDRNTLTLTIVAVYTLKHHCPPSVLLLLPFSSSPSHCSSEEETAVLGCAEQRQWRCVPGQQHCLLETALQTPSCRRGHLHKWRTMWEKVHVAVCDYSGYGNHLHVHHAQIIYMYIYVLHIHSHVHVIIVTIVYICVCWAQSMDSDDPWMELRKAWIHVSRGQSMDCSMNDK